MFFRFNMIGIIDIIGFRHQLSDDERVQNQQDY